MQAALPKGMRILISESLYFCLIVFCVKNHISHTYTIHITQINRKEKCAQSKRKSKRRRICTGKSPPFHDEMKRARERKALRRSKANK